MWLKRLINGNPSTSEAIFVILLNQLLQLQFSKYVLILQGFVSYIFQLCLSASVWAEERAWGEIRS